MVYGFGSPKLSKYKINKIYELFLRTCDLLQCTLDANV